PRDDAHHYLEIKLEGDSPNRRGIGSRLILTTGAHKQYIYQSPFRGYLSTMDDRAHFGLGRSKRVDSLEVIWPDGRYQLLTGLDVDRMVTVRQRDATEGARASGLGARKSRTPSPEARAPFQPMDPRRSLKYKQPERTTVDYDVQP